MTPPSSFLSFTPPRARLPTPSPRPSRRPPLATATTTPARPPTWQRSVGTLPHSTQPTAHHARNAIGDRNTLFDDHHPTSRFRDMQGPDAAASRPHRRKRDTRWGHLDYALCVCVWVGVVCLPQTTSSALAVERAYHKLDGKSVIVNHTGCRELAVASPHQRSWQAEASVPAGGGSYSPIEQY